MHAAVVSEFGHAPRYETFPDPITGDADEIVVDVVAAGLHPRVRSQADGSHYTSTGELPLVPGIDGVGRDAAGVLRYFVLPDSTLGSMAERTVVDARRSVVLPSGSDPIAVAAAMNPAMSSWVALRRRIRFEAGHHVLVLGATGNAGRMAIQVARLLGADRIVAVGRGAERMEGARALGATDVVALEGDPAEVAERLGRAAASVDVVLDYLWGQPAADAIGAIVPRRADDGAPLSWIQIGSVAGATAAIPSAALRAVRLQIVGSGQGSVSPADIREELPAIGTAITRGDLAVAVRAVPLADVGAAWADPGSGSRLVLTP